MNEPLSIPSLDDVQSRRLAAQLLDVARQMSACEGIDSFASTGVLPDLFFSLLAELYAAYDAYIAHNLAASELKVHCRFGCTRCCHQAVHGVYAFEIINLYRQLRMLSDYSTIEAEFVDYAETFQATVAQISEFEDGDPADPAMRAVEAFAAANRPCPLLLGDNCRVYAHRPAPCRMYHSLTRPVFCTTLQGQTFNLQIPSETQALLWTLSDRLVFPFPTFLAQGLVTLALQSQRAVPSSKRGVEE